MRQVAITAKAAPLCRTALLSDNEQRLTGHHETQHIDTFSWGVANRGASIRVPNDVEQNDWKGYLEDRRPASNCDPYKVAALIVEAVKQA